MSAQKETRVLRYGAEAIAEAARLIRAGEVVAMPTETVYGLAADATNPQAVERVYAAKGRPSFNPLIVHVAGLAEAEAIGLFEDAARRLAAAFWPGPLTLVVPLREGSGIAPLVTAGLATIAVRAPAHRAMRDLIAAAGRPLAAPSANASGAISPTSAAHVVRSLGGRIPLVVDGGATERGLESTIVRVGQGGVGILRPGPVSIEQVEAACGGTHPQPLPSREGRVVAPGMMASHYAPSKPVRLEATDAAADEWLIGFGAVAGDESLSASGDLEEAAANLFAALHRAEASARPRIAVAPVPEARLGVAINDRLRRAAAPRGA
ncbi:MAG: threonylcarbamoyl-AMP synthase [Alphaproteobacteria bacterium]|nr:threonylcarbamoyl-AMP synthase [Alphaproteobacteria bacterium]